MRAIKEQEAHERTSDKKNANQQATKGERERRKPERKLEGFLAQKPGRM
jgi:hypothetical protein